MQVIREERATKKSQGVHKTAAAYAAVAARLHVPVIAKGKGAVVTDVDGNEYVDYDGGRGSLLLGHADERVVAAVTKAVAKGHAFAALGEAHVRLAELIVSRFPGAEKVSLVGTNTAARSAAVRMAGCVTDRNSWAGSRETPAYVSPQAMQHREVRLNDMAGAEQLFARQGEDIAAVMIEPVATRGGPVAPDDGYLARLRALCDDHGALLIFDETVSGLRLGPGGAAKRFGVTPDLFCLGRSISGGLPLALVAGRGDVLCDRRAAAVAAELDASGLEPAVAAALAVFQATGESDFFEPLEEKAALLAKGLSDAAAEANAPLEAVRTGSMVGLMQRAEGPSGRAVSRSGSAGYFAAFYEAMLDHGVYLNPDASWPWFVSAAHEASDIDRTVEAAGRVFGQVR